jgi:branched-chain amino acid transport system substrate-binding protein
MEADEGAAAASAASDPGATADAGGNGPILIGVAGPFTGPSAQFGFQIEKATQLARDEINARGGINGRQVRIMQEDDEGNPSSASTIARRLAQNPGVVAVVGHFNSRCSLNGREIYDEAGVVMLSPASTNTTVCEGSPWAFRNIFHDKFQGETIANYIHDVLGKESVAVLYENDDYGAGLRGHFVNHANVIGLRVLSEQAYDNTTGDFLPLARAATAGEPDIIFMSGLYSEAARIAEAMQEVGGDTPLIGGDGVFSDEYIKLAGDAANGTLVTTPFLFELAGPQAEGFVAEYKSRWPDANPDAWAALAYDAFNMVAWAIEEAGTDREAIRDFLASVDTPEEAFVGLTGATYFDQSGDCLKPIKIAQVQGGAFVPASQQFE